MESTVRSLRTTRFTLFVFAVIVWGCGFFLLDNIVGVPHVLLPLLPVIVALPVWFLAMRFALDVRGLTGPRLFANGRVVLLYILANVLTITGYVLANIIARALHHPEYVVPGAMLALGQHFLFLGLAFGEKREYLTLVVFCLTGILVPLVVPLKIKVGMVVTMGNGGGWMVVTSIIGLIWLWSMAIRLFIVGERSLRQIKGAQSAVQAG